MNNRLDKLMLTDQNFTMCLHCLMNFHVACDLFTNCITIVTKNAFCKVVLADKNFLEKQKKRSCKSVGSTLFQHHSLALYKGKQTWLFNRRMISQNLIIKCPHDQKNTPKINMKITFPHSISYPHSLQINHYTS